MNLFRKKSGFTLLGPCNTHVVVEQTSKSQEIDIDPNGPSPVVGSIEVELILLGQTADACWRQHLLAVSQDTQRRLDLCRIIDKTEHDREEVHDTNMDRVLIEETLRRVFVDRFVKVAVGTIANWIFLAFGVLAATRRIRDRVFIKGLVAAGRKP